MKWYEKGHDPHDYNSMRDLSISQPIIVDKFEDKELPDPMSENLAKMVSDKLNDFCSAVLALRELEQFRRFFNKCGVAGSADKSRVI